jgi:hypothetical protein
MGEREHAGAHENDSGTELGDERQHGRTFGGGRNAPPREACRQARERDAACDHPDEDEARVARPFDGILDGGMHEPGEPCLDSRRPFDFTQHGLAPACRALLASGAGILASAT